jgi:hypothetical protein
MTIVKIDDNEYELDSLSEITKDHLQSLQFVDGEISRNLARTAVLQTARAAYAKALRESLLVQESTLMGDTIRLS